MVAAVTYSCPMCRKSFDAQVAACAACNLKLKWCPQCGKGNPALAVACLACGNLFKPSGPGADATGRVTPPASPGVQPRGAPEPAATSANYGDSSRGSPAPAAPTGSLPQAQANVKPENKPAVAGILPNATELLQNLAALSQTLPTIPAPAAAAPNAAAPVATPVQLPVAGPAAAPAPARTAPPAPWPSPSAVPLATVQPPAPAMPVPHSSSCPFQLRYQLNARHQRDHQSLLQWQLCGPFLASEMEVHVQFEGLLAGTPPRTVNLFPQATVDCPSIAITLRFAGAAVLGFRLTLQGRSGMPHSRWHAEIPIQVEDHHPAALHVTGDMIVMGSQGGNPLKQLLGGGSGDGMLSSFGAGQGVWWTADLHPDHDYVRRLARVCVEYATPPAATSPNDGFAPGGIEMGVIHVSERQRGIRHLVATKVGRVCSFGRGGEKSPTWRVRPEPYDYDHHAMLSGDHVHVELRNSLAWCIDHSRNGTWFNDKDYRLEARRPEFLSECDRFWLLRFGVMPLIARPSGNSAMGVQTVHLHRSDDLADRISYLLTIGQRPAPALLPQDSQPSFWFHWLIRGKTTTPILRIYAGQNMVDLPEHQPQVVDGTLRICWRRWSASRDQNDLVEAFTQEN